MVYIFVLAYSFCHFSVSLQYVIESYDLTCDIIHR